MKKIINGRLYDTDTAKPIGADGSNGSHSDFNYWEETLYKKRTGEYFLHGYGGPRSRYSKCFGDNSWGWGEAIIPLSYAKAREWAEEHMSADEYGEIFGMPSEDVEPVALNIQIDASLMAKIRARAAKDGASLTATVAALLNKALGE